MLLSFYSPVIAAGTIAAGACQITKTKEPI